MTKKLLLTAGAVAALAFAGAANAGDLTSASRISGVTVNGAYGEGSGATAAKTYQVATERNLAAAGIKTDYSTLANNFTFGNLDNPVTVAAGATGLTFVVTYNLTGPASFADVSAAVVRLGTITGSSVTPVLSNNGRTLQAYVTINNNGAGAAQVAVNSVELTGFNLVVTGKEAVAVSYTLAQVIGGQTVALDSSDATNIVTFRSAFSKFFTASNASILAALPSFETFKTDSAQGLLSASTTSITTQALSTSIASGVYENLQADGINAAEVIASAEVTVTGPQIEDLQATFGGQELPEDATGSSATWTLAGGNLGASALTLSPAEDVSIMEGRYSATIVPTYTANWSGTASVTRNLVTIGLDGTNFYAPWFGLGGTASSATLRIANNGTTATGPIVVQLRARNGSTAAATSVTFPGVAANSFRSITGAELRQAFGTDAANADLLVSIQSQAYGTVSAKVRTVQTNGNTFESSLGLLTEAGATAASVQSLSTQVSNVQTTVNEINGNTQPEAPVEP